MEENQLHIPEGWKKVILGKVLKYEQPYRFIVKSTNYDNKSGTPVLTAGKSFILGFTNETDNIYEQLPVIIFDDFTTDTKFVDFPFKVKSSAMKFLKANKQNELDLKFMFEKIQTLRITETGGDHKRRWISEFSKIDVLLPDFSEQQKIASILSKTDQAIAQTEALIAKYNRIKTGLMQDLLTKGIDENGTIRSEKTHEFKDSELGRIPKAWKCLSLKDCCDKIQDGTHFSPKTDENGIYKYVTSKNIRFGFLDFENVEYLNENAHRIIYQRCAVKFGDLLLTKDGANTGNASLNNLVEEFSLLSSVALIRGKEKVVLNSFMLQFLLSEIGQKLLKDEMSGNAITRITLTIINKIPIVIPPINEQKKIIVLLRKKDEVLINEKTNLAKLQSLKTGLMQDLLSGKVRVNQLITN